MAKPIIGITLDCEEEGSFAASPYYALRKHYSEAILQSGGIPIFLAHEQEIVAEYLAMVDGLLVPGGMADIDPQLYGVTEKHDCTVIIPSRTNFDLTIMRTAFAMHIPILGICAGEQVMNVIFGGTMVQHIPEQIPNHANHYHNMPRHHIAHSVNITEGTILARLVGEDKHEFMVNSHHHQAAATTGSEVIVSARAPDGVIEAIEHSKHPFCLGIEWHPEYMHTEEDRRIMRGFVLAAEQYRIEKRMETLKPKAVD